MKRILCITPVKHLNGVFEMLENCCEVIYEPSISKDDLRQLLGDSTIDKIFTNPNKQGFILDESVLSGSSIKVINTCSTGTNHIDMQYCFWGIYFFWKQSHFICSWTNTSHFESKKMTIEILESFHRGCIWIFGSEILQVLSLHTNVDGIAELYWKVLMSMKKKIIFRDYFFFVW